MAKSVIEYLVSMGDSLSDPGAMDHKKLAGFIPMDGLSGLKGKSPKGAFTNGYVWDTDFGTSLVEEKIIKDFRRRGEDSTNIADDIITHDPRIEKPLQDDFKLDSYRHIDFNGQDFFRYYDEGGLTSYNYSGRMTANIKLFATEHIVSNLDEKRQLLFADDKARAITPEHKKKTLVTEWSGANDLITVNSKPTKQEAERAVQARLHNVEELIKAGYYNFALFNLPDLSLTPNFHRLGGQEQENAKEVSSYFNQLLKDGVEKLRQQYQDRSIDIFDVSQTFSEAYNNPQKFGFDPAKKDIPYTESKDFEIKPNKTSPAPGYMFWDKTGHPTAHLHAVLAEKFYEEYSEKYHFSAPHESLLTQFRENYGQKWADDMNGWFGFFRRSNLTYQASTLNLEAILRHALHEDGKRTREVITKLGWINAQGELISKNPALISAMEQLNEEHNDNTTEMTSLF